MGELRLIVKEEFLVLCKHEVSVSTELPAKATIALSYASSIRYYFPLLCKSLCPHPAGRGVLIRWNRFVRHALALKIWTVHVPEIPSELLLADLESRVKPVDFIRRQTV